MDNQYNNQYNNQFNNQFNGQFNNGGFNMVPQGPQGKKGMCITAFVLGIVGCVFGWIPYLSIAGLICGGVGTLLGILGYKSYKEIGQAYGMAVAGLVLGICGLGFSIIGFFTCTMPFISACCTACSAASRASSSISDLGKYLSYY